MQLTTRFQVRTLMGIVALVAFGFGITYEIKNRAVRDQLLKRRADRYREAAIHWRRAVECKYTASVKKAYRPAERFGLRVTV